MNNNMEFGTLHKILDGTINTININGVTFTEVLMYQDSILDLKSIIVATI